MSQIEFDKYRTVIFDFDGVICDTNKIKSSAMWRTVYSVTNVQTANSFTDYFTGLNGVPRAEKIVAYFPRDISKKILRIYSEELRDNLSSATLIPGIKGLLDKLKTWREEGRLDAIFVLSGGEKLEIDALVESKGLDGYFDEIFCAPENKVKNVEIMCPSYPVIFFGDSHHDYEVANLYEFDFVFVSGATEITNWNDAIRDWGMVCSVSDFNDEV